MKPAGEAGDVTISKRISAAGRGEVGAGQGGFTLLEVMVAFIIASLASLVLYQAGFNGAAETAIAARYQEAVVRAQSRLASIGTLTPLQAAQASGDDGGGFHWILDVTAESSSGTVTLYDVQVTERFGDRQVTLLTQKLGAGR
jgi:general secretion pathway protein I